MVNTQIIVGRLGKAPELQHTINGNPVAQFSVAVSEKWKSKTGSEEEHTEWFDVNVFGKLAENCSKYLGKGSLVYIEGRTKTDKWENDKGEKKQKTKVNAALVKFLDKKEQ